jgi:hypothetical protein
MILKQHCKEFYSYLRREKFHVLGSFGLRMIGKFGSIYMRVNMVYCKQSADEEPFSIDRLPHKTCNDCDFQLCLNQAMPSLQPIYTVV